MYNSLYTIFFSTESNKDFFLYSSKKDAMIHETVQLP